MPEALELWRKINGCSNQAKSQTFSEIDSNDGTRTRVSCYANCQNGSEIVLYTVEGGGHTWRGSFRQPRFFGNTSQEIRANQVIWDFFERPTLS